MWYGVYGTNVRYMRRGKLNDLMEDLRKGGIRATIPTDIGIGKIDDEDHAYKSDEGDRDGEQNVAYQLAIGKGFKQMLFLALENLDLM